MKVAADRDRAPLVGGIDQAVEALGGVRGDRQQSDVVDLCRYPHRLTYAETATMPTGVKTKSDGRWVLAAPDGGGSLEFR
jgi:hypothetical protein